MSADVRIDLTVTVDGLPPLLRLGLAEVAGVQGCLDFLAVSDLTDAHKATLRYLAGSDEVADWPITSDPAKP